MEAHARFEMDGYAAFAVLESFDAHELSEYSQFIESCGEEYAELTKTRMPG